MLVNIYVSELKTQLDVINLIYFLHQALILYCCVSCECTSPAQEECLLPWFPAEVPSGCGSTYSNQHAGCPGFHASQELVSIVKGSLIHLLALATIGINDSVKIFNVFMCECMGGKNKNSQAQRKETNISGMCINLCVLGYNYILKCYPCFISKVSFIWYTAAEYYILISFSSLRLLCRIFFSHLHLCLW